MYQPISCDFYDQLEVAIERKIPSTIIYTDNQEKKTIQGLVVSLCIKETKEYLLLDNGQYIPLHLIISFNGRVYIEEI